MGGLFGGGSQKISTSAPLISSLRMQTSSYGRAIPLLYGKTRVASNVIWFGDFKSIEHRSTQSAGGKGGGGGTTMESISYTYQTAVLLGLCEGPILGVTNAWVGKKSGSIGNWNLSQFTGSYDQQPMPYLATYHPGEALSYRGTAYVGTGLFDLGDDATLPNMTFEVDSSFGFSAEIRDANPADVARDYCTNPYYGAGVPASKFGDLSAFSDFCIANGLFVSPAYTEQEQAHEAMSRLFKLTNSGVYYSEGKIKAVPYSDLAATGNGVTFTPNLTPVYDLTDDDFLADAGTDPIECSRVATSDAYNCIRVKFFNRASGYNEEIAEAKDQASIEQFGLRVQEIELHEIVDANIARFVAQQILQRTLYVRNTYEFRLGWKYALLEPTDLVTLTDVALGLDKSPVRITEIEEDEDGDLTVRAEEVPVGSVGATKYPTQTSDGYTVNYNDPPGPANTPVIFEPPLALAGSPEIWIAMSGGANWGGCNVWVSDDNATYQRIGRITGKSRHGILSAALASGSGVDTINTAKVDLSVSGGALLAATEQNALDLVTLCYVDGELIAYRDATLTAPNKYDLGYLVRGAYGTTIGSHAAGTKFARLDQTLTKFPYDKARVGKTVYLKFQSFNIYGSGIEDLATLAPVTYQITGAPLADVTGLALEQPFTGRSCKIKWNAVDAAAGYTVEVWAGSPQTLRRTVSVGDARRYEYSWEDATADGGPWRQLTFKVRAISQTGASGNWATLVASNPVPAVLTGVAVTAGFNSVFFSCSTPADPDFAGVRIWLSTASGFTPGDSSLVYDGPDCFATLYKLANGTALAAGTTYYLKAAGYDSFGKTGLNISSEVSVVPVSVAGGIKPGEITATMVASGAIDMTKLASGIRPPRVVSSLPTLPNAAWSDGDMAVLTTDGKLYRVVAGAWKKDVDAADISGQVQAAQIAGLEASKMTGQLSDSQLAAIAAAKITGTITASQIAAGAVDATKFASGIQPVSIVSSLPTVSGYTGPKVVMLTTDNKLYRYTGSAWVATVATTDLSGTVSDAQIAGMAASKVTGTIVGTQIADSAISTPKLAAGSVTTAKLVAGAVTANEIAAATITGAKIAASTITAANIAADTITAAQIAAGAIGASEIAAAAITAGKIAAGVVTATELAAGAVTTAKLAAAAVTANEIAAGAIVTAKLAASAVTANELAAGAVTTAKLTTGAVTANEIAAATITGAKIAASTITGSNIAADAITAAQIAAGAIGAAEIAAGAITSEKLFIGQSGSALNQDPACSDATAWNGLEGGAVIASITDGIAGSTVLRSPAASQRVWLSTKLIPIDQGKTYRVRARVRRTSTNNNAFILSVNIYDGAGTQVTTPKEGSLSWYPWWQVPGTAWTETVGYVGFGTSRPFPSNAAAVRIGGYFNYLAGPGYHEAQDIRIEEVLPGTLIQDGSITTNKVAANAITADKIAANQISATHVIAGSLTGDLLAANTITADKIQAGAITANEIAANAITAAKIAAGAVTADKVSASSLSAISANLGTITAGLAQNAAGTNFMNLSATGTQSFIKVGSAVDIKADGSGVFARTIVSAPDVKASGTASVNSGWIGGSGSWTAYIDTGVNLPVGWSTASSDMYQASATIAGGLSQGGGANGYATVDVVYGDGLLSGAANSPIDNRMYIKFTWNGAGTSGGSIQITSIAWKLVRV